MPRNKKLSLLPDRRTQFTLNEVASILNVNVQSVQKLVRDGTLIATKVKGRWTVKDADLMNIISRIKK